MLLRATARLIAVLLLGVSLQAAALAQEIYRTPGPWLDDHGNPFDLTRLLG